MRKHFLIEQPPISSKYRLLVDNINDTTTFAMTTDVDKVWYNRKVLGDDMSILLETYTALSDNGTTVVLPAGRYVTIWQITKDEKTQRIWFIDHSSNISFRHLGKQIMGDTYFSDNVYNEFERIQELLRSSFNPDLDIVELVLAATS